MTDDIVQRLRATPNWKRESFGAWKDCVLTYDRAPFEAADEIERLREIARAALEKHQTGIRYIVRGKEDEVLVFLREWTLVADALGEICTSQPTGDSHG